MNRDAILATLIGLALGLIITGVLVIGPNLISQLPKFKLPSENPKISSIPTPLAKAPIFSVTSPLPETIQSNSELIVSGSALPGAVVVVSGALDEDVVSVGADAKFAGKITLPEGRAEIVVTQFLNGKATIIKIIVYYTQDNH